MASVKSKLSWRWTWQWTWKATKRYIKDKKKKKENVGLPLNGVGNQVMKDMEKDEVLKPFFALFYWKGLFSGLPCHLIQKGSLGEQNVPSTVGKDQVKFCLSKSVTFKFLGPRGMHPMVLTKLVNVIVRPCSVYHLWKVVVISRGPQWPEKIWW